MGVALVALLVRANPACAQDELSAAEVAKYEQLLKSGSGKFAEGDFAGARADLTAAYKIYPNPALLFSIASTHRREGNADKAALGYQRFLDECASEVCRVENKEQIRIAEETIAAAADKGEEGGDEIEGEANPQRDQTPPPSPGRIWVWSGIGVAALGVGLLGVAGVEQLRASGLENDIEDTLAANGNMWTTALADMEDDGKSLRTRARVLLGLGTVATVAGVGLLVYGLTRPPAEDADDELTWSPMTGPGLAGVALSGSF